MRTSKTCVLHPSFPNTGDFAPTVEEKDCQGYIERVDEADLGKLPTSTFKYAAKNGNTSLKFHLRRHHPREWAAIMGDSDETPTPRKRQGEAESKPGSNFVASFYRSVKKIKKDSAKAKTFFSLVTLLIIFARLPFSIVMQPMFRALIWFLDPSIPMPTRNDTTHGVLPVMVNDCRMSLRQTLRTVLGATVTFDLWMSKKTDDILSIDLNFICDKWIWHHKHLGLVAMNGQTQGVVVARMLKAIFTDFQLMGKLFAMVFDGGGEFLD